MLKTWSRRLRQERHLRAAQRVIRSAQSRGATLDEWVDLAMGFPSQGNVKVRTVQRRSEILELVNRVADLKPETILEIGTYRAGTLLLWSQIATRKVISCDLEIAAHMRPLYAQFAPETSQCAVELLEGDSHTQAFRERVVAACGGEVDFLFIDGDHSTDGVRQDYEMYRSLVRPGGLIAFHDIVARQPIASNQVHAFWRELVETEPPGTTRELIEDPAQVGFGIGVVQRAIPGAS